MSKRQEYIASIRYENGLPPPLLPPKLLKYKTNPEEEVDSPHLITSLYNKTNVTPLIKLDDDLGMPLDLMQIPGLLNDMDTKYLYGFENVGLHPEDRVLLRDPRVDRLTKTDMSKVTFLRRTEYVSTSITSHHGVGIKASTVAAQTKRSLADSQDDIGEESDLNASEIVSKVENTFDAMDRNITKLKHPVKKKLRAVKAWDLLPDTASMDQSFYSLRLMGSAILHKDEREKLAMASALFRPVELEEDEWISLYTTDPKDSETICNDLERTIDDTMGTSKDDKVFKFKRLRDFDMKQIQEAISGSSTNSLTDLVVILNDENNTAYYKPLRSRIELKRRRVNDIIRPLVRQHNLDQINITLRNPSAKEANLSDKLRTKFDPINFPVVDEEEEGDDVEQSVQQEEEKPALESREKEINNTIEAPENGNTEEDIKVEAAQNLTEESTDNVVKEESDQAKD